MASVHGQESDGRQVRAHGVGVVGGDAGRPELLQHQGFEIDEVARTTSRILAGLDAGDDGVAG